MVARRGRAPETLEEARRRANRELGRAQQTIRSLRILYLVFGVCIALPSIFLLLAAPALGILAAFPLLIAAGFFVGAVRVRHEPGAWTLVLACVLTGFTLLQFLIGTMFGILMYGFLSFILWAFTPTALKLQRLLREYPDLRGAQVMEGRRTSKRRGTARRRR